VRRSLTGRDRLRESAGVHTLDLTSDDDIVTNGIVRAAKLIVEPSPAPDAGKSET
jgi:hypothetical protein